MPTYDNWTESITSHSSVNSSLQPEYEEPEAEPQAEQETEPEAEPDVPLVSPLSSSSAAVRPVAKTNVVKKEDVCPKTICTYKRERRGRPWVQCSGCGQWCHCKCVNLTKAKADKLRGWRCPLC